MDGDYDVFAELLIVDELEEILDDDYDYDAESVQ
jgi:hypothetical protein